MISRVNVLSRSIVHDVVLIWRLSATNTSSVLFNTPTFTRMHHTCLVTHTPLGIVDNVYVKIIWLRRQCVSLSYIANAVEVHCSSCASLYFVFQRRNFLHILSIQIPLYSTFFNVSKVGHFHLTNSLGGCKFLFRTFIEVPALMLKLMLICVYIPKSAFLVANFIK